MNILVIGGTGTVGSQVVKELRKLDAEITVLTRSEQRPPNLPEDVPFITGNLLEPKSIRHIFDDHEAVFLLNAVSQTETHEALMAVNGAQIADIKKIVYLSVFNAEKAAHLPHFGAKVGVETAFKKSGITYTILRPNSFFQNDLWLKEPILNYKVYPNPMGSKGVSRVDIRDIAEAAAIVLVGGDGDGETINLVGPEALTGTQCAEIWSEELGDTIQYGGEDLDAWEQEAVQQMPDWMAFDLRRMYKYFQEHGMAATEEDVRRQTELLDHPPRSFRDFVAETAETW